ncbi:hypothetical protein AB0D46_15915 [Streptomyces sp. NPDC048383]|uniref:hypothetical protein n=1 Tax=Streptomyces sp. NPDC048383 TaxID=3155386 RepID=UPI003441AB47
MTTSATPPPPYPSTLYNPYAGLTFVPRLPPTAYALPLFMLAQQQPGGHVRATHDELATDPP